MNCGGFMVSLRLPSANYNGHEESIIWKCITHWNGGLEPFLCWKRKYWKWSCKYHFVELLLKPTTWVLACLYSCNLTLAVHGILNVICVHATIVFRTSLSIICETSKIQLASITKLLHCLIQLAICITCSSNNNNNHDEDNNQQPNTNQL